MFQPKRAGRCALAVAASAAAVSIGVPASAGAAPGAVFALRPETSGPYYVFRAHPGQTISGRIRVVNTGSAPGSARVYAVDATTGPTSGASYLTDARGREVGAWTKLSIGRVTLRPHQSQVVSFTLRVPDGALAGDHLGGIVADPGVRPGRTVKRGSSAFKINVRTLTVIAVEVKVPGVRVPAMSIDGIYAGGLRGYQQLFIRLRNFGNVLVKGSGSLLVETPDGKRLKDSSFALDTFVPKTGIAFPVLVHGKALPTGSYRARVTVHYDGRTVTRWFDFKVSARDLAQVFGSQPQTSPGGGGKSRLWLLIAGGVLLMVLGFGAAMLWARRQRKRLEAALRERDLEELDLWSPGADAASAPVAGDGAEGETHA